MNGGAYAALGQPGVGLFAMIVIGLLAGWIAERITESRHGLITNLVVGVIGPSWAANLPTSSTSPCSVSSARSLRRSWCGARSVDMAAGEGGGAQPPAPR